CAKKKASTNLSRRAEAHGAIEALFYAHLFRQSEAGHSGVDVTALLQRDPSDARSARAPSCAPSQQRRGGVTPRHLPVAHDRDARLTVRTLDARGHLKRARKMSRGRAHTRPR